MSYSSDFIDKVRDANNIVDALSEYTQLKRNGGRLVGLCPFHREKTPSFSVSEDRQRYYCFGCKKAGDIYSVLIDLKGLSFPEAIEYLADRSGIILPQQTRATAKEKEVKTHRERMIKINQLAAQSFHNCLKQLDSTHELWAYCKKRGLTPAIVDLFQIGYALPSWDALAFQFQNADVSLEMATELGLVRSRKEGTGYYDLFRDRLMFPIFSHRGECIGFGGRALNDEQMPKYLNSPESEVFIKGNTFYGLNETAKYIRSEDHVIIVEGYMDLLALYAAGVQNVVATLGTALTPQHAKLIKRVTHNVVVMFDGDEAGQTAAERSLPILLAEGLLPKGVSLPDKLDPDDFVRQQGASVLKESVRSAPDLFTLVLDRELLNYRGSSADKVMMLEKISPILDIVQDSRLKELYVSEFAQKIGVEPSWIIKALRTPPKSVPRAENRHPVTAPMPNDVKITGSRASLEGAPKSELFLLNIALTTSDRFNSIWGSDVISQFSHEGVRDVFLKAEERYRQMPNEFAKLSAYLMDHTSTPYLLGLTLTEPLCSMNDGAVELFMSDCIHQVKDNFLRNQARELAASLKSTPHHERQQKLERIMNIQKSKHTLRRDRES